MDDFIIKIVEGAKLLTAVADARVLGSCNDSGVQRLIFVRPEKFIESDLIMHFISGGEEHEPINIGQTNEFVVTGDLTANRELRLHLAFVSDGGERIEHTDAINFVLRESVMGLISAEAPITDQLRELRGTAFAGVEYAGAELVFRNAAGDEVERVLLGTGVDVGGPGPAGEGVPGGGAAGQILGKKSGSDFDTGWIDQTGGGGSVATDLRGVLYIGDSITEQIDESLNLTSLVSNASGQVTASGAFSAAYITGTRYVYIYNAVPVEFCGRFEIASASATQIVMTNPDAPVNTTAEPRMAGRPIRLACRCRNSAGYQVVSHMMSGQCVPYLISLGLSGSGTAEWEPAIERYLQSIRPRFVHILLGTNDLGSDSVVTASVERYRSMTEKIAAFGATPIIGLIPPRDLYVARGIRYNRALSSLAAAKGYPVIDYYSVLVDSETGKFKTLLSNDGLHPSGNGRVAMGRAAAPQLREIFGIPAGLPQSAAENFASGLNLLDDPLLTKPKVLINTAAFSGYVGVDSKYETWGDSTMLRAVSEIVPRSDGFGNDMVANIDFLQNLTLNYTRITTTRAAAYTAPRDCVLTAIFSGEIAPGEGGIFNAAPITFTYSINEGETVTNYILNMGSASSYSPEYSYVGDGEFVAMSAPVFLREGDVIRDCAVRMTLQGHGPVKAKMGRIMIKIVRLEDFLNG